MSFKHPYMDKCGKGLGSTVGGGDSSQRVPIYKTLLQPSTAGSSDLIAVKLYKI